VFPAKYELSVYIVVQLFVSFSSSLLAWSSLWRGRVNGVLGSVAARLRNEEVDDSYKTPNPFNIGSSVLWYIVFQCEYVA
jgi:hypothetical protein